MEIIQAIETTTDLILNPRPMSEREWAAIKACHKIDEIDDLELTIAQVAMNLDLINSFNDVRKRRVTLRLNNKVVQRPLGSQIAWIQDDNGIDHWASLRASKSLEHVHIITPSLSALLLNMS